LDDKTEKNFITKLRVLRNKVPHLFIEFNQRHFKAQRFGYQDGFLEFNIDTLGHPFSKPKSKVKELPIWYSAIRTAILHKGSVNAQLMFKSRFYLKDTKDIDKPKFIKTAEKALIAFKPLYAFLR